MEEEHHLEHHLEHHDHSHGSHAPTTVCVTYSTQNVKYIRIAYVIMIIVVLVIILYLKLYQLKPWPLLIIPIIIFMINLYFCSDLTEDVENELLRTSLLPVGAIIMIPILSWMKAEYVGDHLQFIKLIVLAMGLT